MAVDGADVAGDGTVHFRGMERVSVSHVISEKFMGETLSLTVLRNEKVQNVLILASDLTSGYSVRNCLLSTVDGVKVTNLRHLAQLLGIKTLRHQLGHNEQQQQPDQKILASDLTSGYSVRNCLLSTVDGVKVTNLRHLAQLLGIKTLRHQLGHNEQRQQPDQKVKHPNEFVTFVLEEKLQVVLHRGKAEAMLPGILKQHAIHRQTSDNL
ncbi:uncharacterized protein EMH_0023060 [Eimeria mitis]|uniref:Protease Do-like PDZ domain-containing protein n=1 Tax=Eimeria mitis TaxID=44415 RepID=U6KHM3_9EIME|nr:uncharacterized protein EMH_0023060 [Eimeria mitis]CDJ34958.1 hypothetical protein EMH_0023060 [Eimeria mitis]